MTPAIDILEDRISDAMVAATGKKGCIAHVRPATDPKFGDYQANGVMALAREIKTDPRKLAEQVVENLDVDDICEQPEVAGPGFINLWLKADFLANVLLEVNKDSRNRLGIESASQPETVVVDFSCPNIAKQMHVGHLRSTIIGDCICRTLEFLGHKVIRQNHIGDWGTQFGMLVQQMIDEGTYPMKGTGFDTLSYLESLYKKAKNRYDTDEQFAKSARECVVSLQSGTGGWEGWDDVKRRWNDILKISLSQINTVYADLGVLLNDSDIRGESFYNDMLPDVVKDLKDEGIGEESEGAVCVFPEGFKNKEGEPLPFIVQKSDG
ncbi:MAG: arginine--tRNA ligase domain-containing protein, partial [Planctomycetota bacterium]